MSRSGPGVAVLILGLCLASPTLATILSTGAVSPAGLNGDNLDLTGQSVFIGNLGVGTLDVDAGSSLTADILVLGIGAGGDGTVSIDGAGTLATLTGVSDGSSAVNRIDVGSSGTGDLTISDGATVDASSPRCDPALCNAFIANAAGSDGTLTISDAGSSLSVINAFVVGGAAVFTLANDGVDFGTPGGASTAQVAIEAGGTLNSESSFIATAAGPSAIGTETSTAQVSVQDPGSTWNVRPVDTEDVAALRLGAGPRTLGTLLIENAGTVDVRGPRAELLVGVPTAATPFQSGEGVLTLDGGNANVAAGAMNAIFNVAGGFLSTGRAELQNASEIAVTSDEGAQVLVGGGGNGELNLSGGSQLRVEGGVGIAQTFLTLGGVASFSSGTLNVAGVGTRIDVSDPDGPLTTPTALAVGFAAPGDLDISAGAQVRVDVGSGSGGVSLGGAAGGSQPTSGVGTARVSGLGSVFEVVGDNNSIDVGASGSGTLEVELGALASALFLRLGVESTADGDTTIRSGGQVVLQDEPGSPIASGVIVGDQGSGQLTVDGGELRIVGTGGPGHALSIGGSSVANGGNGRVDVDGPASRIAVEGPEGGLAVGFDGVGTLSITGGGRVELTNATAAGGVIGATPGSFGTLLVGDPGSELDAGPALLIGKQPGGLIDGGTGSAIVSNGATLTATDFVIGALGVLGGNGSVVGNVSVMGGTVAPGLSPGTLQVDGSVQVDMGSIEVEVGGPGTSQRDDLVATGGVAVGPNGGIEVRFINAFAPTNGQSLVLLSDVTLDPAAQVTYSGAVEDASFEVSTPGGQLTFTALEDFVATSPPDQDLDGVPDASDNCVAVSNPGQEDADAGNDDDSNLAGIQHYGDACDFDLDDDGLVAASDFFTGLRPCLGADLALRPECAEADFDGDGLVAASDFFIGLRPALGSAPGPGVTE